MRKHELGDDCSMPGDVWSAAFEDQLRVSSLWCPFAFAPLSAPRAHDQAYALACLTSALHCDWPAELGRCRTPPRSDAPAGEASESTRALFGQALLMALRADPGGARRAWDIMLLGRTTVQEPGTSKAALYDVLSGRWSAVPLGPAAECLKLVAGTVPGSASLAQPGRHRRVVESREAVWAPDIEKLVVAIGVTE